MNEKLNKINIVQLVLVVVSVLLNSLSLIISSLFVSWIFFIGLGLAIFAFMSNIVGAFKKEKLSILYTILSTVSIVLAVFAFFNYINIAEAFISTMI